MINWEDYKNFSMHEFQCSHTGLCDMDKDFMDKLQALRDHVGFPLIVSSVYRHPTHPIEAAKDKAGEHSLGKAADIVIRGEKAYTLLKAALLLGFTRIGVSQKGSGRFIHLGTATEKDGFSSPTIWSY